MSHGIDPATLALRPASPNEFDEFMRRCRDDYVEEIVANLRVSVAEAAAKADADTARLLPDGQATVDHHVLAIVDADDAVVGDIWLGINRRADGVEAFGYDFWIRPELRGTGLGRRSMELAADHARQLGATRLALNVFGDNERARHLYERFGFHVTNVNMALPLTPTADEH